MAKSEAKRQRLREQREIGKCELYDFCEAHSFQTRLINEYQIRVNESVDVYPTNKRFCVLSETKPIWGKYEKLEELLPYLSTRQNSDRSVQ